MEPQLPKPQLPNIEQAPAAPFERPPDQLEGGVLQESKEKNLINPEVNRAQPGIVPTQQLQTDGQTGIVPTQQPASIQPHDPVVQTGMPVVAADEDVIEKEWVDKAKQIVERNKNDPRMQKHEVSSLQADYLKKRYGKTIKLPDDR